MTDAAHRAPAFTGRPQAIYIDGIGTGPDGSEPMPSIVTERSAAPEPETLLPRAWRHMTEEHRAVFESAPDGILVVDEEGVIRSANPMAGRLFGYAPDELIGQGVDVLVPDDVRRVHREHRARYVRSPQTRPMGIGLELGGRRRDGTTFPVEISLSPLTSDGGLRVIVTVRDVTQRKRLRDFGAGALQASEDERQRISRELHDGTAQQLATLLLRLRLVERDLADDEAKARMRELRDDIAAAAEGVRSIARGLRPPELEDAGLVAALQAHMRGVRESAGMDVQLEAGPVDDVLGADQRLVLYRVVQEAVSNAVRHSGADVVEVQVRKADTHVIATVLDGGRGFRPGDEGRDGGGLGLLGMHERAAMVGGRVHIESEPGGGTRVTLELPVREAQES